MLGEVSTSMNPTRVMAVIVLDALAVIATWVSIGVATFLYSSCGEPTKRLADPRGFPVDELVKEYDFDQIQQLDSRRVWFLDARNYDAYNAGHVPGAISFPRSAITVEFASQKLESASKDQQIIVYCSNILCEDSMVVAKLLLSLGYSNVGVYRGGWQEWNENSGRL